MKTLITGATGSIGSQLAQHLSNHGHEIVVLGRNEKKARELIQAPFYFYEWKNIQTFPPKEAFEGVNAIVHLVGETIDQPWNAENKQKIFSSRIESAKNILFVLNKFHFNPRTWISASAVGYYGDRKNEVLTETSEPGFGFLSEVCQALENNVEEHGPATMRRVFLRFGIVLERNHGMLGKVLPLFSKSLGAPLATGEQWMSWIHIQDLLNVIEFALNSPTLKGAVNAVAPHPVRNKEFTKILSVVLNKKCLLPAVPAWALKMALRERADLVLYSQRVIPSALMENGFHFTHPKLSLALQDILRNSIKNSANLHEAKR